MAPKAAAGIYGGSKFGFTESRLEAARKAVFDGVVEADGSGRRSWLDADCPGLKVTVNGGTGSSVFYFQGKVNNSTVRKAIGDTDAVRLVEARETVRRLRYDRTVAGALAPRSSAADGNADADQTPVVKGVLDAYMDAHTTGRWLPGSRSRKPTDRTMKNYRDLRRATMSDRRTGEDFEQLTLQAFADRLPAIHAALVKRAPIQANRFVQLVRNVFGYASDSGLWSQHNPAISTGKADRLARAPEESRQRVLTDAEWKRLDAALKADAPLWRDLFTWSLLTLQRMGACCRARWDDIDMTGHDAAWTIPACDMKGRRSGHVVPLADIRAALELLKARRKAVPPSCPWLFPAAAADGPVVSYKTAWRRVLTRAKLWTEDRDRRPRPHDLRRTGGSRMVTAGVALNVVTRALGDAPSSVSMVAKVYACVADDALKDAFAAVSRKRSRRR